MKLLTINETAKECELPAYMLRQMLKHGELPGFYSASRFYVNVPMLLEKLESDSRANMSNGKNK